MVGLPDSKTEPMLLNGTDITPYSSNATNNENLTDDTARIRDQAFALPRLVRPGSNSNNNNSYTLKFDVLDDKKVNADNINAEPVVVKKVAAGLMHSNNQTKKDKSMTGGDGGNGSLSSGSSLATIASIAITDPDPNYHHNDLGGSGNEKNIRNEKWYHTILQVSVPFFIAGMGTIGAGRVLTSAKDLPAFKEVPQLMILTTALQGLKGNLDMCLASRLCTQANLGNMTSRREIAKMIIGNIALVQIQAIVAAMCLSLFGMGVGTLNENGAWAWDRALLLAVSCMCTATSSCFILDFVMIAVIMISYRYKMNPDNVATPLAASIGDVVSISILSVIASQFFLKLNNEIWVLYVVLAIFVVLLPVWILIVLKNKYTRSVLKSGWVPILSALLISGGGGLVLEKMIDMYEGPEVFQPVINGIGGNLVSVHASRMSTMLHQSSIMGILPPHGKIWVFPWTALFVGSPYAKVARLLVALAIPGQLVFVFIADALNPGNCTLHVYFVLSYIIVSVVQVMILLYVAHIIIHAMWRFKIDPDNSAIPYLTALGDLSGSLLLALAFFFMDKINRPYCTE
ncbi:solute carrier family 41 member 3 isoform X1 [Pseudomyrmex gracilis]|uniref:solute carrier family 41 member 3 isoform X1 n=2 Tax=Pseudomyrmex gracilis TaxID=219809 RepID=UPI0009951964|nr:solute carrier family 41 member 3 isoform X1 [Pseudomyrmex gracilis]XP_020285416.1 solute carrier family 41 member 3 isoform X1 [Pseudomyrmex gracilis]